MRPYPPAVRLAVDGMESELIQAMLSTWMTYLMHEHEAKYTKALEGIMGAERGQPAHLGTGAEADLLT